MLGFILGAGLLVAFLVFLVGILTYVWFSLALMSMANHRSIPNSWLAFIPIANLYIMGLLLGELDLFGNKYPNPEMILPIAGLIGILTTNIAFIGGLISIVVLVLQVIAIYQLVEKYQVGRGALTAVLMILLPPVGAYLLYSIKDIQV